jgi:hypothetical protein
MYQKEKLMPFPGNMIQGAVNTVNQVAGGALGAVTGALGSASGALQTAGKLAGALSNLSNPAALISSLRSLNLPAGGQTSTSNPNSSASFGPNDAPGDWRVRLDVPAAFKSSPILTPLREANGLIFPYTPSIQISSSAGYEDQALTHQNYSFIFYNSSKADQIQIVAPFNIEDSAQGAYWLAAVHMLRSCTKMFTGDDPNQGNPPPILKLNGYGDYVFKNVPVVVRSFSVDLPQDVSYINVQPGAGSEGLAGGTGPLSSIAGIAAGATGLAGLAGALGANKLSNTLGKVGAVGGAIAGIGNLLTGGSSLPGGGPFGSAGNSWVPVKSSMTVILQPIYSRESMRQFSLTKFVNGGYVDGGYI